MHRGQQRHFAPQSRQRQPKAAAAHRGVQYLAGAEGEPGFPAPQQHSVGVAAVAVMIDRRNVDAGELPSRRDEAHAEFQLFDAMQVAVAEIAGRHDRFAAVEPAAVEPRHVAGTAVDIVGGRAFDVLDILRFALDDAPADAGEPRVVFQKADCGRKKSFRSRMSPSIR